MAGPPAGVRSSMVVLFAPVHLDDFNGDISAEPMDEARAPGMLSPAQMSS